MALRLEVFVSSNGITQAPGVDEAKAVMLWFAFTMKLAT
jgi:hypothetical protein